jgi:hypothetical protein
VKAFGIEVRRNEAVKPPTGEYGLDGDNFANKYVEALQDVNPALPGFLKFDAFDEMVHTDSTAKAVVWVPKLALRSAHWEHKPASKDGIDGLIAEACDWNFGLGDHAGGGHAAQSWQQSIDQASLTLRYGAMFEEIVWGDLLTWRSSDGEERPLIPIDRLAPRLPRTIRSVKWKDGRISEIEQSLLNTKPIPGDKLAYYALEPEPGRWDGVSLLRAAWGPWELKRQLMIAAGIAWDRWASGFPVVRYPKSVAPPALEKAEELGRAIRNHEHAYAAFEGGPPTELNGDDGWDITIQGGAGVLPDPTPLMIRYELAIYGAGLMQWMALGTSSKTGARATAQVQDEPFYVFLEAFAGDVAAARQRQVLRRFVDVNFGTEYATPELTVSKIQSEDVEKLARTLGELRTAGFNLSYRELQNYVMTLAHLPAMPETLSATGEGEGLPAVGEQTVLPVD